MKTVNEILQEAGLPPPPKGEDRYYAICPRCSGQRSAAHRKTKCLGITITAEGVQWGCNHCHFKGGTYYTGKDSDPVIASYGYEDEHGTILFRKLRTASKKFWQQRPDGNGGWTSGVKSIRRVPYRLPELIAAISTDRTILVVEGEKDVDCLRQLGVPGTCNPEGASEPGKKPKWRLEYSEALRDAVIVIVPDHDAAGYAHADAIAELSNGIAKSIRILKLADHWPDCPKGGDVSDWLAAGHTSEQLDGLIALAKPWTPTGTNNAPSPADGDAAADRKIAELATLSELAYQKRRKDEAKSLGISVSALDKMVKRGRTTAADEESALPHWNVVPWDGDVSGSELLDNLKAIFQKYIVLPAGADDAIALWILHSWTMDAGDISPFLVLVSPTKRCGKTSTLILLLYLTPRSELASNISPSALFRYVEDICPTLLIDEADSFVGENEEMRGILNSGHTKAAAHVIRNVEVNGEHKPRRFSTWAPKAIATIRALADTLEDRAIVIQLQRKPKSSRVARLRKRDCDEFAMLRRKAARWAEINFDALAADPDPNIPEQLNDRAADNWRALLQVANLAGGHWPQRARDAACLLSGEGHESTSTNVELLTDIRLAFGEAEGIRSIDLVAALIANPERPWATWGKKNDKPLTQRQLASLLKPFCIVSENVTVEGLDEAKGYKRTRFQEAWDAYLPAKKSGQNTFSPSIPDSDPSIRRSLTGTGTSGVFRSVGEAPADGSKSDDLSYCRSGYDASTDRKSESDAKENLTTNLTAPWPLVCEHCGRPERPDALVQTYAINDREYVLHPHCHADWLAGPDPDGWSFNLDDADDPEKSSATSAGDGLDIPVFLRRSS